MSRTARPIPPQKITLSMPSDLLERLDRHLWSDLEQQVPYGARADLIATLLLNYLNLVEGTQ